MKAHHAAAAALALAGGYLTVLVRSGHGWPRWATRAAGTYSYDLFSYDLFERSTGRNLHRIDPDLHRWPPATPCRSAQAPR
jgi:hypothetical protein